MINEPCPSATPLEKSMSEAGKLREARRQAQEGVG